MLVETPQSCPLHEGLRLNPSGSRGCDSNKLTVTPAHHPSLKISNVYFSPQKPAIMRFQNTVLVLLASRILPVLSSIDFFVSNKTNACEVADAHVGQDCVSNTERGGLCAYVPDIKQIYCCPAPDPTCWSWRINCTGGNSSTAGPDQILCSVSGTCA